MMLSFLMVVACILFVLSRLSVGYLRNFIFFPGFECFRIGLSEKGLLLYIISSFRSLLSYFIFFFILQIEPIPGGNLPPGFDPSTCRSV